MNGLTRRKFGLYLAAAGAAGLGAPPVIGASAARVIIIGGGPGGATMARYLKRDAPELEVVLFEPKQTYTTCFFSNLYLGGLRTYQSITHDYKRLESRFGVRIFHDLVTEIDPAAKRIITRGGIKMGYDKLVLAPGIDFDYDGIEGLGPEAEHIFPHAYRGGGQTLVLKKKIEAMEDGGSFIMAPPANIYRCPPAPYERVSMIAWYLKQHKPKSNIVILDSKNNFSKQDLFLEGWENHYPGMIEWLPADITGGIKAVNAKSGEIITEDETFTPAAANIIPEQMAGAIARKAGLTDKTGWCPVIAGTMESKLAKDIHIIGDAAKASAMPKSAVAANSQAKALAMLMRAELTGAPSFKPKFRNACWSLITPRDGVALGATYEPTDEGFKTTGLFSSTTGEDVKTRRSTAREAIGWYSSVVKDIFG